MSSNNAIKEQFKGAYGYVRGLSIDSFFQLSWLAVFFVLIVAKFVMYRGLGLNGDDFVRNAALAVIACIPFVLFLINIKKFKAKDYVPFFIILSIILIVIGLTAWLNPEVIPFLTRDNYGLERVLRPDAAIYAFLFFSLVSNPKDIMKNLRIYAYVDFLYLVIVELAPALIRGYWIDINYDGSIVHFSYNLTFGYAMVFPVTIFLCNWLRNKNKLDLVLAITGFYFIITEGNRGSALLIFVFVILIGFSDLFKEKERNEKFKVFIKMVAALALLFAFMMIVVPRINYLVNMISCNSSNVADDVRSVEMLKDGDFTNSNGRFSIWGAVIDGIKDGGIFGRGFFGDRPIVFPMHYAAYSHNIALELTASFGIIGVILTVLLIAESIRMILVVQERAWSDVYIVLITVSCQLFLSLSIWYVWQIWAAMAIALKYSMQTGTGLYGRLQHNGKGVC